MGLDCNGNTDDIMALIRTNFIPKDLDTKSPNEAVKIRWPTNVDKNVLWNGQRIWNNRQNIGKDII